MYVWQDGSSVPEGWVYCLVGFILLCWMVKSLICYSRRMSMRLGLEHASPSSGRRPRRPTITGSPSSRTSGHSASFWLKLWPMEEYLIQVCDLFYTPVNSHFTWLTNSKEFNLNYFLWQCLEIFHWINTFSLFFVFKQIDGFYSAYDQLHWYL